MPNISPWAQIQGSLPPLIPKQAEQQAPQTVVFAPVHAPTLHAGQGDTVAGIPPAPSPRPALFASPTAGSLPDVQQHIEGELAKDYRKDVDPWGSPDNHPGVFGKIMHGLNVATGGVGTRQKQEQGLQGQLGNVTTLESNQAQKAAQAKDEEAQAGEEQALTGKTQEDTKEMPEKAQSAEALQKAQTEEAGARTHVLENPLATTPEMDTYRKLTAMGMSPAAALQEIEKDKQLALKPAALPHITKLVNGVPHIFSSTDSGASYTIDQGAAPQNYGELVLPTKTQQITDAQTGLPTVMGWDEKTQKYDIPQGTSGTGTYAHQIQSAAAINKMLYKSVYPLVDQMEKSGEFGVVKGRLEDFLNKDVGNAPPDVAQFHQQMNGVISMMMGMYGFRRQQAVNQLVGEMGARMTPESLKAALHGIEQHADSVIGGAVQTPGNAENGPGNQEVPAGNKANEPKKGDKKNGFTFDGIGWTK